MMPNTSASTETWILKHCKTSEGGAPFRTRNWKRQTVTVIVTVAKESDWVPCFGRYEARVRRLESEPVWWRSSPLHTLYY